MDNRAAHPHQEKEGGGGGYLPSHIYNHNLPYGLKKKRLGDIYNFSQGGLNRHEGQSQSRNHFILSQGNCSN